MKKKTYWDGAPVGFYEPIKIKGKIKWDVKLSKDSGFFCERQEDAQLMSMLVRIMKKLGIREVEFYEEALKRDEFVETQHKIAKSGKFVELD